MTSTNDPLAALFSSQTCSTLLPPSRADEFFEALFGDAEEGAYDLALAYVGSHGSTLRFDILLKERPGHCLACNLTYGLPQVFTRHPILDIAG
ncbi:MAG: pancreas/duodenum homeobox protein 1, partial [Desulfofustis sp.]|nr:pancreas/duodenum homeobox protein 1 [Desulfofustis sp.]